MIDLMLYTVAVRDLDEASENYQKLFGMKEVEPRFHNPIGNFDAVPMGYVDGSRVLNLLHPSADDAPLARLMRDRANPSNPHGEGIYMLAFEMDDPEGFYKRAGDAGARTSRRDDSQLLWIHPASANFVFMELRARNMTKPGSEALAKFKETKSILDLMLYTVAVRNLDEAAANYKKYFGMKEVGPRFHNPIGNFDAVPMGYVDGVRVCNLLHPSAPDAPLARLMKDRTNPMNPDGEGIYMLAFELDDPEAFAQRVEANGGRITRRNDSNYLWVHPTSSHFVFMELRPRSGSAQSDAAAEPARAST